MIPVALRGIKHHGGNVREALLLSSDLFLRRLLVIQSLLHDGIYNLLQRTDFAKIRNLPISASFLYRYSAALEENQALSPTSHPAF